MNVPDWLWQSVVADLLTEGLPLTVWLAWKYRKDIAGKRKGIVIKLQPLTLHAEFQPASITVGSERQILYDIEAPTPSLARRLEELASWYLHVS